MTLSSVVIIIAAVVYLAILFSVAFCGDRYQKPLPPQLRAWLFSLSLAVYCSGWAFLGSVGQSTGNLWSFLPTYLGPILIFVLFHKALSKIIIISKRENASSIADFLAGRYGKSRALAVVITLLCLIGILPYIALQLKALVLSVDVLTGLFDSAKDAVTHWQTPLIASLALALFTMFFGTRNLSVTEHNNGVILAVVFESIVKLTAFITIGLFVTFGLFNGFQDILNQAGQLPEQSASLSQSGTWPTLLTQTLITMMAIFCLPRQFHITAVENTEVRDLRLGRWVFIIYLTLFAVFIPFIAMAGRILLPGDTIPDTYVIQLPLSHGYSALSLVAFIGCASASISMVVICCISLSTMASNDLLIPWLLRKQKERQPFEVFRRYLLNIRRLTILAIIAMAYICYLLLVPSVSLGTIGLIAFTAIAQLAPAMVGALYWKQANRRGVLAGLITGTILWGYLLILPLWIERFNWSSSLFPGLDWLHANPLQLPLEPFTQFMLLSITMNFLVFTLVSLTTRPSFSEHWQAGRFIGQELDFEPANRTLINVQLSDLINFLSRFIGKQKTMDSFHQYALAHGRILDLKSNADSEWIDLTEHLLAAVLGASSARAMVKTAVEGREMHVSDVVRIIDEASEVLEFNRSLLQGAIENISQGLSVIDQSLNLVAWNSRYLEIFGYPEGFIQVGRPVADLIRYNSMRGLCGPGDAEQHVARRLNWMRQGTPHVSERMFPNGRVIELIGNPMPGGGFVMSFTDITEFRQTEQELKTVNESLEQRVQERTRELSQLNRDLIEAKSNAEAANQSKSRFLTTISHDLMQPLNAAKLFSASLEHQQGLSQENIELIRHLNSSLGSAEDLINGLLEISRLESGKIVVNRRAFPIAELLETLSIEFQAMAPEYEIDLRIHSPHYIVDSDPRLLRRILQNFLTNAFRYSNGRVLLGARHLRDNIRLEVWDQGPGIPENKLELIFEEFKRLDNHHTQAEKGFGLGLAIAHGLSRVLGHPLSVRSWEGKGSVFSVTVPLQQTGQHKREVTATTSTAQPPQTTLAKPGACVLCVDNEENILTGMQSLLSRWGYQVLTARNLTECETLLQRGLIPQIALVDYHLNNNYLGTHLMGWLRTHVSNTLPGIIISADPKENLEMELRKHGLDYLPKPLKPAALRAILNKYVVLG